MPVVGPRGVRQGQFWIQRVLAHGLQQRGVWQDIRIKRCWASLSSGSIDRNHWRNTFLSQKLTLNACCERLLLFRISPAVCERFYYQSQNLFGGVTRVTKTVYTSDSCTKHQNCRQTVTAVVKCPVNRYMRHIPGICDRVTMVIRITL